MTFLGWYTCDLLGLVQPHAHFHLVVSVGKTTVRSTGHQLDAFPCPSSIRCRWIAKWWAEARCVCSIARNLCCKVARIAFSNRLSGIDHFTRIDLTTVLKLKQSAPGQSSRQCAQALSAGREARARLHGGRCGLHCSRHGVLGMLDARGIRSEWLKSIEYSRPGRAHARVWGGLEAKRQWAGERQAPSQAPCRRGGQ